MNNLTDRQKQIHRHIETQKEAEKKGSIKICIALLSIPISLEERDGKKKRNV